MTAGTDKSCGECGLCCKLLSAPSLGKPPRKWCVHFRRGRGCDIYADRPAECSGIICGWLVTPQLGEEWRPDRAGFLLHQEAGRILVEGDESATGSQPRQYLTAVPAASKGSIHVDSVRLDC